MPIKLLEPGLMRRTAYWALCASVATVMFSISLLNISCGIFLGASLIYALRTRQLKTDRVLLTLLLAYLAANLMSWAVSAYPGESAKGVFRVLRFCWLFLAVPLVVRDAKQFGLIVKVFVLSALVVGVDGLVQGLTGAELLRGREMTPYTAEIGRVTGPFRHANDFAAHLSLTLTAVAALAVLARGSVSAVDHGLLWVTFAVLAVNLANTYSRGGWVAAGIGLVALILLSGRRSAVLLLAAAAAAFLVLAPAPLKDRMASLADPRSGTMLERRELWRESAAMIGRKPWFGHGVNTYSRVEPLFKAEGSKTDFQYAHNGYLHIAAETGLVGLASFLAVLLAIFVGGLRRLRHMRSGLPKSAAAAFGLGALALLIHSATDTGLQSTLHIHSLWLTLGLAWTALHLDEKTAA